MAHLDGTESHEEVAGVARGGGRTTRRGLTPRSPRRFEPRPFPSPAGARLRSALARAHGFEPFRPNDARRGAHRVRVIAEEIGLDAVVVRGGLDVGGAELDHLWVVADGRVVDITMPVISEAFGALLRAYVAGDLDADDLDRAAHGYTIE
ncbi:MAG: hypothetical protein R3343_06555, partial [Nitriliruptorales bacterium]|nr:hypothetical protein [Nitriliruptorales bacterium]